MLPAHAGQVDRHPVTLNFQAQGLEEQADLWERGDTTCSGYQQLLEYFTFREKFMFVAVNGFEQVDFLPHWNGLK